MPELDPTKQHIGPAPPEQARETLSCHERGRILGTIAVSRATETLGKVSSMGLRRGRTIKRKLQEATEDLRERMSPDDAPDEIVYKTDLAPPVVITERKLSIPTQGLDEEFNLLKQLSPPPPGPKTGIVVNPGR